MASEELQEYASVVWDVSRSHTVSEDYWQRGNDAVLPTWKSTLKERIGVIEETAIHETLLSYVHLRDLCEQNGIETRLREDREGEPAALDREFGWDMVYRDPVYDGTTRARILCMAGVTEEEGEERCNEMGRC